MLSKNVPLKQNQNKELVHKTLVRYSQQVKITVTYLHKTENTTRLLVGIICMWSLPLIGSAF